MGRVKWRVVRQNRVFWSTVVEQKLLDRCSLITFAAYLSHKGEAWLFLEAPKGLPDKEKAGYYLDNSNWCALFENRLEAAIIVVVVTSICIDH